MATKLDFATRNAIADMKREHPEALLCRERGARHRWNWVTDHPLQRGSGYEREFKCDRCTTVKFLAYNYRGQFQKTRYEYPEGYRLPPGIGRLDSDSVHFATKDMFIHAEIARNRNRDRQHPRKPRKLKASV